MNQPLLACGATLAAALIAITCASSQGTPPSSAQRSDAGAQEFGRVQWQRKFAPAAQTSKESGRPILLLFQEVPG